MKTVAIPDIARLTGKGRVSEKNGRKYGKPRNDRIGIGALPKFFFVLFTIDLE